MGLPEKGVLIDLSSVHFDFKLQRSVHITLDQEWNFDTVDLLIIGEVN